MDAMQPFAAVVLVLGLLGGTLFALKRRGLATFKLSSTARTIEVLERTPLTAQHALYLVRVEGRTLLIATAPGSCHLLEADIKGGQL